MTQETAKERIYREKLELISDKSMWHMNFKSSTIKMMMKNAKQALELAENLPDSTGELLVEKLQEQLNTAKKALTESEKMYQKQMDRFLNSEMNESARSHCESQLKLLFPAHKAYEALAAIGGEND